jgi:hypothetical protein
MMIDDWRVLLMAIPAIVNSLRHPCARSAGR